jgi:hypothetical protein
VFFSSLSLADTAGPRVRAAFLLKPTPTSPSLFAAAESHVQSSLSYLGALPRLYKSSPCTPPLHLAFSSMLWCSGTRSP